MKRLLLLLAVLCWPLSAAAFDHAHTAWTTLLNKHVVVLDGGRASQVRYAGFLAERAALKGYLDSLSAVSEAQYTGWSREQRLAFLINAYNAYTVEKILTRYPKLKSIRDFGTFIGNPWKDKFFQLLGKPMTLDGIEHDTIRAPGSFDEPRIHFAVNCASVGCPMLREEAYVAPRLDAQLEEQTQRFLSDRSRNRYDAASGKLRVSSIFDWYGKDFAGGKAYASLPQFFGKYADKLADTPAARQTLRDGKAGLEFLEYDWSLNDVKR